MKVTLNDVINTQWLLNENVCLELEEKIPFKTFMIARFLKRQLPEYERNEVAKFLQVTLLGVNRTTIYKWIKNSFVPAKCYAGFYKKFKANLPQSAEEVFVIKVWSKHKQPNLIAEIEATLDAIENAVFLDEVESKKPDLNLAKIIQKREDTLKKKDVLEVDSVESLEDLVVKLCEDFATGLLTITEACERHGLSYLQFVELITTNDHSRQIYEKATRYANMLQNSRQLTLVDNMIVQLLTAGQHVTEKINYVKKIIPGQLEPRWIEKSKTRSVRQLAPSELITLKMMLLKTVTMGGLEESGEFASMTEAELLDYVVKNNEELQKSLSANPNVNNDL